METGGWKHRKVLVQGGDSSFDKLLEVLKGCVQAIIDCGTGWCLDKTKNATIDDVWVKEDKAGFLFMLHSDGTRMCVGYEFCDGTSATTGRGDANYPLKEGCFVRDYGMRENGGLVFSYINNRYSSDYRVENFETTGDILPPEATLLCGSLVRGDSPYYRKDFLTENSAKESVIGQFSFVCKGHDIIHVRRLTSTNNCEMIVIGDVIDTADEDDIYTDGILSFRSRTTMFSGILSQGSLASHLTHNGKPYNWDTNTGNEYGVYFRSASGVMSYASPTGIGKGYGASAYLAESCKPSTRNRVRYVPIAIMANNTTNDIIRQGDRLKGFFRNDALVATNYALPQGTMIEDGKRYHIGGGLLIGWDKDNEPIF